MSLYSLGYATLRESTIDLLLQTLHGREVWDLGAGSGEAAETFARSGASRVVAVEAKTALWAGKSHAKKRKRVLWRERIEDIKPEEVPSGAVAYVSWPSTCAGTTFALLNVLPHFSTAVIVASMHFGVCCGDAGLWRFLSMRKLEKSIAPETPVESFVDLYQPRSGSQRKTLTPNESAGMLWHRVITDLTYVVPAKCIDAARAHAMAWYDISARNRILEMPSYDWTGNPVHASQPSILPPGR